MRFGLQIGAAGWTELRDVAQAAEGLGFGALYFPDHLVNEGPERQRLPFPAHDPIVIAALAAQATTRIRIGHLVLCNLFRHPAVTARSLATLDELSGGRLIAGLGTGWTETEFRMTGLAFPDIATRLRMLDEALACLRGLWGAGDAPFSFAGEFYRFQDASLTPRPVQRPHPPILLGGSGRGLLRVAARHADALNIISDVGRAGHIATANTSRLDDAAFRAKVAFVREEARRGGRGDRPLAVSSIVFLTLLTDSAAATRASAEATSAMFGMAPEALLRSPMALIGTPEECVVELRRRARECGLDELVFAFAGTDLLRRLHDEVLRHV
jgi:probable F420-dependent oxidoreductase